MVASVAALLWAVHVSDSVLSVPWLGGGFAIAVVLIVAGAWRIRDEEISQVALLTAAFFVASLIHLRIGPTSVHLLLNGLLGVVLGVRACLAIPVGLLLQAALIQHGGLSTLGVNSCVLVLPALLAGWLFAALKAVPWVCRPWFRVGLTAFSTLLVSLAGAYALALWFTGRGDAAGGWDVETAGRLVLHPATLAGLLLFSAAAAWAETRLENAPEFPLGLLSGAVAMLATLLLLGVVLRWGSGEDWQQLAVLVFLAHLPVVVVESVMTGLLVGFLARVKPAMVRWPAEKTECPVDSLA